MVFNRQQPRRGTVTDLITGLLDRGYNRAAQPVLEAVARSVNSGLIAQRLTELEQEAARLAADDLRLTPDNPVLRALLADLDTTLQADSRLIDAAAPALQSDASNAAGTIQRQLSLPGMTDAQLSRLGIVWNRPDPEAVARLLQYAESDAWGALMRQYGDDVLGIVQNQAIRGIALGYNPLRTAREIRRITTNLPAHQANNLMRTLHMTSYRDSTAAHQNANTAIAQQVIRIGTLDPRMCLSCIAEHGAIIWDSDRDAGTPVPRVQDHHSGRCTSIIAVKGRPVNVTTGPEWFASLPEDRQAQQASFARSPGKYEAFQQGRVTLADFRQPYNDPTFGDMLREASLTTALGNK